MIFRSHLIYLAVLCDLFGMVKWPPTIGDKTVTLNYLLGVFFQRLFEKEPSLRFSRIPKLTCAHIFLGGNSNIFLMFTPSCGKSSNFDSYFSYGLVQPPTSDYIVFHSWDIYVWQQVNMQGDSAGVTFLSPMVGGGLSHHWFRSHVKSPGPKKVTRRIARYGICTYLLVN